MTATDSLQGTVAVVTGATRGLGLATAHYLAAHGASIALCSRDGAEAHAVAKDLTESHDVSAIGGAVDVADADAVLRFSDLVRETLGDARVVVNNAAILGPVGAIQHGTEAAWSRAIDVNLKGCVYCVASFRDQLARAGNGRIVNLSGGGIGGPSPMQRTSAYVTSKAGIAALTEALAVELADIGATANAIAPGALPTTFLDGVLDAGADVAGGDLYRDAASRSGTVSDELLEPFFRLLSYVVGTDSAWLTGRVLSARWETPEVLDAKRAAGATANTYRLRRIDGDLFDEVAHGKP